MSYRSAASPFHQGEQAVQTRLGVRESIESWARKVVRSYFPEEHRAFYRELPFLVAAARDAEGRPWATMFAGKPGFLSSPDRHTLAVEASLTSGDALAGALSRGADIGLLGIELATRRRNRVNGRVKTIGRGGFTVAVDQTFGNCPQYIREREWHLEQLADDRPVVRRSSELTDVQVREVRAADTFFIATGHRGSVADPAFGMDASHRGGDPGFVRVTGDGALVIPDYAGNNHYNTIGNLVMDPRAGILFVDFETGGLLQLTGRVQIDWNSPALPEFPGARRLLRFTVDEAVEIEQALPLRWDPPAVGVRSLRVVGKKRESMDVTSFLFEARDGGALADFEPGQHLPLLIETRQHAEPVTRTYSLSNGPGEGRYRISVKRELHGAASTHLHDHVQVGDIVDARLPAGDFILDHAAGPVVLVSAGIGVTPMMSMLSALDSQGTGRPVWFVHGARNRNHHPFAREVRELAARSGAVQLHVCYSQPDPGAEEGHDYHSEGRVDGKLLVNLLPDLDAEFYLCGPASFMATVHDLLEQRGVDPVHIHWESFGPVG